GVVRVAGQQLVEAVHQAGAGVGIGFRGGQGEKVEVRVALVAQDVFHVRQGLLELTRAGQLDGGGALRLDVVRRAVGPDARALQGGLGGAQVLRDAVRALGDRRVAGRPRLAQIVGQGDVEAAAL